MAEAVINGAPLWFVSEGNGLPVLVCHGGLGVDHQLYRATLARLTDGRRVIWYDQRGNGQSRGAAVDSITIEQLADDAVGLLSHLGIERAVLLGHSYGGFVAQEAALRHPSRVAGLILVATGPGQLGSEEVEDEDGVGPPMPEDLLAAFASTPSTDEEMRETFRAVLPHYVHAFDPEALQAGFASTIVRVDAMLRGFEVLASWSCVDRLHRIEAPTLVIGGRLDPVMSWPQQVRIAKRVPDADLVVLEDASHFAWLDQPGAFWSAVDDHLSSSRA